MRPDEYILLNYHHLDEGGSEHGSVHTGCYRVDECGESPSGCDLNVKREGNKLVFNCFSGSCPCAQARKKYVLLGRRQRNTSARGDNIFGTRNIPVYAIPRDAVPTFPRHVASYLEDNNVSVQYARRAGFVWDQGSSKLIYPLSKDGKKGYVFRVLKERLDSQGKGTGNYLKQTKWIRHFPKLSLPHFKGEGKTVYLVESIMSAVSLAERGLPTICVLGINLDSDKLREIRRAIGEGAYSGLVLLPDPDVSQFFARKNLRKLKAECKIKCVLKRLEEKPRYTKEI